MNDKILDDALSKWKDGRVPPTGEFPDAADFEKKFFERAAQEEALRDALKKRRMRVLSLAAVFVLTFCVVISATIFGVRTYKPALPAAMESPKAYNVETLRHKRNSR